MPVLAVWGAEECLATAEYGRRYASCFGNDRCAPVKGPLT
jgi:hypothetical protein